MLKKFIIFAISTLIATSGKAANMSEINAHSFSFKTIDGKPLPLAAYKGKAILVVNTASKCGFTPQYDEIEKLYEKYKGKGLVVIAVPSNDFGDQEPGTEKDIKEFTEQNYKITFPLTMKEEVSSDNPHPFYKWAGEQAGFLGKPKWNFHKYLIGKDGKLLNWYSSTTSVTSEDVIKDIEAALK